jgi:hypothetical protein
VKFVKGNTSLSIVKLKQDTMSKTIIKKRTIAFRFAKIIICCFLFVILSCKHYPLNPDCLTPNTDTSENSAPNLIPCHPDTVYFNATILPLFVSNCAKAGCHDAISHQEGFVFNSYSNIMASGEIEAGDPNEGEIMELIKETDPDKIMPPPPNAALTQQQINQISTWISQGAQNNYCNSCDTNNVLYSTKVKTLLDLKCKGCHNTGSASGGVDLSTYNGAVATAQTGKLLGAVKHQTPYSPMPKGGQKLPACEIDLISIWITNQYPQ